ncbi:putative membrane protein [Dyadobacter jejuensis]|uniref:Putative membrane protein n=2 Tax=Dyadobacter jejuensis TaxID=1082580 RepID=A0A316AKL4_9BACT|nr:putative membrane protein [Dyadobacter jejuensis]
MKKIGINVAILACFLAVAACNGTQNKDSAEMAEERNEEIHDDTALEDDSEFVVEAADGGMLEVKLGELAQERGLSPHVKSFGEKMAQEHGKANEELKALAKEKNLQLPSQLSDDKQKHFDDLSMKNGKEFDEAYAALMVDDHEEDVKAFKEAAEESHDPEVKAWAAGKVPTLESHLTMAKKLKEQVK